MPLGLDYDPARLAEICRRYRVAKLELFGSRARGTARPDSDVDLLVTFEEGQTPGLEFVALADELEAVLAHPVDLLTRRALEEHRNHFFRARAMANVEALYAA